MPRTRAARGGARGRGRGRGRGVGRGAARGGRGGRGGHGRGRGAARTGANPVGAKPMEIDQEQAFIANLGDLDTPMGKLKSIFTGKCKFDDHYDAQLQDLEQYLSVMAVLDRSGVEVSSLVY